MMNVDSHIIELLDVYDLSGKINKYSVVYIYGAGYVGQTIYDYLDEHGCSKLIKYFFITEGETFELKGRDVYEISKSLIEDNSIILLAAKRGIRKQLKAKCEVLGIDNYIEIMFFDDEKDYEWYSSLPEELYCVEIKDWYKRCTSIDLNLANPKTFNDKINWSKLYDKDPRRTEYADKYLVRNHVKEKIGSQYLIPIYGAWEHFDDIDFDKLPNQFVLKCNHGSGWNLIVKNKRDLDYNEARKKFNLWMNTNFAFVCGYEMHYKNIKPLIIAEEYIGELDSNLLDYKVHCFKGKPKFIQVIGNRNFENHTGKQAIYDFDWNEKKWCFDDYPKYEYLLEKPNCLDELYDLSEKLSSDFQYVRIDFYILSKILFGEMTFTPGSGIYKYIKNYKECDALRLGSYF